MKISLIAATFLLGSCSMARIVSAPSAAVEIPYGDNAAAARYLNVNGIKLYVETYGQGRPLLLLHGNDQSISAMERQIAYFSERFMVVAVDSRGHGNSELGQAPLTYEKIADDLVQLMAELKLAPAYVLGWSDGGIVGLLLAMQHPELVEKLAIMGAALNPAGAHSWALDAVIKQREFVDERVKSGDKSADWHRQLQLLDLLQFQPDIAAASLQTITAPTLVMAGDMDVIRNAHTLEIFDNIPNAHLAIFPGSTHYIPVQQPELFNTTVDGFFSEPFTRPTTREIFESSP